VKKKKKKKKTHRRSFITPTAQPSKTKQTKNEKDEEATNAWWKALQRGPLIPFVVRRRRK
jgi:hypothetical protein